MRCTLTTTYDPVTLLFMSSLERTGTIIPMSWGQLLLPRIATKTNGGTVSAILSLAVVFQIKRWTLGTAQPAQQKSLCESPARGIRVYPQRAHPASRGAWESLCAPERARGGIWDHQQLPDSTEHQGQTLEALTAAAVQENWELTSKLQICHHSYLAPNIRS